MRPEIPPEKFAEWLKQLPKEVISHGNKQERKRAEEDYRKFLFMFHKGQCSLCSKPIKTFSANSPCLHWLLRPKGFKKKHFPILFSEFTYFRISAYIRWVASVEAPLKNINDLEEEHPDGKLIDFSAKYKHLKWSFSCGKSDFEGHKSSSSGNFPHYHMQIQLDGRAFIKYGDFHIPFHNDDLYDIELLTKHSDVAKHTYGHGAGMAELLESESGLEYVIENTVPTDNYDDAAYELSTIIMAEEGKTISGDIVAEAIKEAKEKNKTIASVVREKLKDANITTVISAGKGVPEASPRTTRRKKTDNKKIHRTQKTGPVIKLNPAVRTKVRRNWKK